MSRLHRRGVPRRRAATVVPLDALEITKLAVDPQMSNNCYLLRCTDTGDQVLIDAADEPERLLELIGDGGLTTVVTTHQHWDHHRALADVVAGHRRRRSSPAQPDADAITEQTGVPVDHARRRGRHASRSALLARGDPGRRPHPRLDLPAVRRRRPATRTCSPATRLFPGGVGNTQATRRASRQLIDDVSSQDLRRASPTRPGSTPATATTRPSAPSGRTSTEWRERGW